MPRLLTSGHILKRSESSENNRHHYLIIFCLTFAVYFWSASRTVVMEDDGYFIMAAFYNGIAHPPGYPLYTLIAHPITYLPFGSVAFRIHLLSGLFASFSCIFLWVIAYRLLGNRVCAYVSALTLAFSNIFWSQAIISEVYTLNVMLVVIILLLILIATDGNKNKSIDNVCRLIMLFYGLALSNHWPLVILTTPMFIATLWPVQRDFIRSSIRGMPFLLLGLLPYLWMVVRSQMDPEISFYGPIDSLHDFWFYVSRQGYHEIDTSISAGWYDKLLFCRYFLSENFRQFGSIGVGFLIAGFVFQWKFFKKHVCTALILGYLGSSVFLILLLDFDYDQLHRLTFQVYPVISYVIASIWIGVGFLAVCNFLGGLRYFKNSLQFTLITLCILVTGSTFAGNAPLNYRADDRWGETYATVMLKSLPKNSLLFLSGDANVGPVGYMNKIAGIRKDVELFSVKGQVFRNRIYRPFKVTYQEMKGKIDKFIQSSTRPVYYTSDLIHDYGTEDNGLYYKVLKDKPGDFLSVVADPAVFSYLELLHKNGPPWDPMEKLQYYTVMSNGCRTLALIQQQIHNTENLYTRKLEKLTEDICDNLVGIYYRVDIMLDQESPDFPLIRKMLNQAENHLDEASLKAETAYLDYYRGVLSLRESRKDEGVKYLLHSLNIWDHPDNPARSEIDKLNEPGSPR